MSTPSGAPTEKEDALVWDTVVKETLSDRGNGIQPCSPNRVTRIPHGAALVGEGQGGGHLSRQHFPDGPAPGCRGWRNCSDPFEGPPSVFPVLLLSSLPIFLIPHGLAFVTLEESPYRISTEAGWFWGEVTETDIFLWILCYHMQGWFYDWYFNKSYL